MKFPKLAALAVGSTLALCTQFAPVMTSAGLAAAGAATVTEPPPPSAPAPFGHACTPKYGIRFCPGDQGDRVASFDGVPLDADVALPASGTGPYPLIVLLHGLGGSKADYETTKDDGGIDDVTMADHGYAVLMYTARGFGDSCGTAASRADTPTCAKGWIQLADQRYEIRDTQYLAGRLVDEGLVKPQIAVAGVSYGGGQSLELAMEKNRMRLPDGRFVAFTSPLHHVAMSVAAAYAMWPWDDLVTALDPNGNLSTDTDSPPSADTQPAGVAKQSWDQLLYATTAHYYLAPPGSDPQSDLTTWEHDIMAGEPYSPAEGKVLSILQDDKSAVGIPMASGGPAPTAIQSGWTDTLFPVSEALHYANAVRSAGSHTPMLLMFDDVGHGWAQNKTEDVARTNAAGISFLDSIMLSHRAPRTGVIAIAQTCPSSAPSGDEVSGTSLQALGPDTVTIAGSAAQTVSSKGGDPATAAALNPAYASKLCHQFPATKEPGTATYERTVGTGGLTMLGGATIRAHIHITGDYPELVGRLWDVNPQGTRQIVAMGVYRPSVLQAAGTSSTASANEHVLFELNPNEYHFAAGDHIELELVGSNAPYFRASNGTFSISVTALSATLRVH